MSNFSYNILRRYKDGKSIRVIIKNSFGYKYDVQLKHLLKGHIPNFVDKRNPFSLENISVWLKLFRSDFQLHKKSVYKGSKEKLEFIHIDPKCMGRFKMRWDHIYGGNGCPICGGRQIGEKNSLYSISPEIAGEWSDLNLITPHDVTNFSGKSVYWKCSNCGYGNNGEWKTEINNRTTGNGCPNCWKNQNESYLARELKDYFIVSHGAKTEYRILKNPKTSRWLPYDIYIPCGDNLDLNGFYIEVNGRHHYEISSWTFLLSEKNKTSPEKEMEYQKNRDKLKKKFAKKNGTYIEIDLRKTKTLLEAIKYIESFL